MSYDIRYKTYDECYKAVCEDGLNIRFCHPKFRSNEYIVYEATKNDGLSLLYVPSKFAHNYETALRAVQSNGLAYNCLPNVIRDDNTIQLAAIQECGLVYDFLNDKSIVNDAIMEEALKTNPKLLDSYFSKYKNCSFVHYNAAKYGEDVYSGKVIKKDNPKLSMATVFRNREFLRARVFDRYEEAVKWLDYNIDVVKKEEEKRIDSLDGYDDSISRRDYRYFENDAYRDKHPENIEKYKKEDEEHQRYVDRIRAENRTIRTYGEYTEKESAAVINVYDDGER